MGHPTMQENDTAKLTPTSFSCFSHFCTHLFDIKRYGKESKVHCHLVFSHMPEPSVCHIVFHLSENSFRFYAPPASMPDSFF